MQNKVFFSPHTTPLKKTQDTHIQAIDRMDMCTIKIFNQNQSITLKR
jgi:hypothetical protein